MAADAGGGGLGVAGADRLQQFGVFGEVGGDPAGVGLHDGDTHPQLAVAELVVEAGEDLVARVADDLGVERAVLVRDGGEVPGLGQSALLGEEPLQPGDEGGGCGDGAARGVLLDQQPGLDDVGDLLGGDRQDQGTLLRVELQQPLDLQFEERLTDRSAGDPDGLGEAALGEEGAAFVAAVQDGLLHVPVDAVGGGRLLLGGGGGGAEDMHTG